MIHGRTIRLYGRTVRYFDPTFYVFTLGEGETLSLRGSTSLTYGAGLREIKLHERTGMEEGINKLAGWLSGNNGWR